MPERVVAYLGGLNLVVLAEYLHQHGATEAVLFAEVGVARGVTARLVANGHRAQLLRVVIEEVRYADAETP